MTDDRTPLKFALDIPFVETLGMQLWRFDSGVAEISLDVRPDMRHVDVVIDRNRPLRLLAISPRKFVSGDGNMTMEFSRGNDDSDMTLRYVPNAGLAEVVVTSASFAQR